jgi:hypothetical protein
MTVTYHYDNPWVVAIVLGVFLTVVLLWIGIPWANELRYWLRGRRLARMSPERREAEIRGYIEKLKARR